MKTSFVVALVGLLAAGVLQAQSPAAAPTDPQIAMIVVTADNVDIDASGQQDIQSKSEGFCEPDDSRPHFG